jgi:2'-5' RNA ligase
VAAAKRRMNEGQRKPEIYSLWLMPEGPTADRLQTLITDLSAKYKTPDFPPHVTLIGALNLPEAKAITKTAQIAERIEPFEIQLDEIAHLDQYFRCVFVKAKTSEILMNANSAARDVFGQRSNEEYLPHLSLIYGALDSHIRQRIMQNIGNELKITFLVKEIHLYYTGATPKLWHRVARKSCGRRESDV